jgi:hypothetical protein
VVTDAQAHNQKASTDINTHRCTKHKPASMVTCHPQSTGLPTLMMQRHTTLIVNSFHNTCAQSAPQQQLCLPNSKKQNVPNQQQPAGLWNRSGSAAPLRASRSRPALPCSKLSKDSVQACACGTCCLTIAAGRTTAMPATSNRHAHMRHSQVSSAQSSQHPGTRKTQCMPDAGHAVTILQQMHLQSQLPPRNK